MGIMRTLDVFLLWNQFTETAKKLSSDIH